MIIQSGQTANDSTVVAKNLSVLQLFISRMPKMCAILQLVSAFVTAVQFTKVSISSKN